MSNIILLSKDEAIEYIEKCRENNVDILGFDVFLVYEDERIHPFLEYSKDYSDSYHNNSSRNWDIAINDINEANIINNRFVYEVVEKGFAY
ncbi:MAG: hypothetical protein JXN65_02175 [Clostridia bacterium]|nr:hypothetical protein [Clostridia bacterium]